MSFPLTALITCKDEAKNIEACVASTRKLADEVLIADSGSTDGTLELARSLADRVIEREYVNSGDFKNWAIPQAKHEWVLIIDADERVTGELAAEIESVVSSPPSDLNICAYSVQRRNYFLGHALNHGDWARDEVVRLIRKHQCRYALHTDHSEIDVKSRELGKLQSKLVHYTAWDLTTYVEKMTRYAEQQAQLWHENGVRPQWHHVWLNAPMRFLKSYVLRAGFRDGRVGFLIASLTAYYSFLKQFLLWQACHRRSQTELDAAYATSRKAESLQEELVTPDSNSPGTRSAA